MDNTAFNGTQHSNGSRPGNQLSVDPAPDWSPYVSEEQSLTTLKDLGKAIWRRLLVVVLVALALVGGTVGYSLSQTPQYETSIKVLIGKEEGIPSVPTDVLALQQLTSTVAEVTATEAVAERVTQSLDIPLTAQDILQNVSVEPLGETQVLEITYQDPDPRQASLVANALGEELSNEISQVSSNSITITSLERAATPQVPVSPTPARNGVLALVLGLMLGVGLALLLDNLDDSWRSPEEAEQVSGVPTLGVVRQFKGLKIKDVKKEGRN